MFQFPADDDFEACLNFPLDDVHVKSTDRSRDGSDENRSSDITDSVPKSANCCSLPRMRKINTNNSQCATSHESVPNEGASNRTSNVHDVVDKYTNHCFPSPRMRRISPSDSPIKRVSSSSPNLQDTRYHINAASTPKSSKVEYERKFPGPAGLIAKRSREDACCSSSVSPHKPWNTSNAQADEVAGSFFDCGPWRQLQDDMSLHESLSNILTEYTIGYLKRINLTNQTPRKMPLFAAVITHIDCSVSDPIIILKDPSGEIKGTLHRDLWDQYGSSLTLGSALLLRHVGVITMTNKRKSCINVTTYNLVTIYTCAAGGKGVEVYKIAPISSILDGTRIVTATSSKLANESCADVETFSPARARAEHAMESNAPNSTNTIEPKRSSPDVPFAVEATDESFEVQDIVSNVLDGIDVDTMFDEF